MRISAVYLSRCVLEISSQKMVRGEKFLTREMRNYVSLPGNIHKEMPQFDAPQNGAELSKNFR